MKRNIASTTLIIIFVVTLCMGLASAAHAAEHCSNAKAAGTWGLTLTGTLLLPTGPVPGAAVARVRIDADGKTSGTEARNVGGGFANETLTGSLTVNSDCRATVTASVYESGVLVRTVVLAAVFVDDSNKVRMAQESLTLPDGTTIPVVITVEGDKLFREEGD